MSFSESNRNLFRPGIVVIVIVVVLSFFGFFNAPRHLVQSAFQGVLSFLYERSVGFKNITGALADRKGLIAAMDKCQVDRARVVVDAARLQLLEQDNETLKQQLHFEDRVDTSLITARVIGSALDTTPGLIMINRGSITGVRVDQPVMTGDGILVGKIARVEPEISFVRLVNDNQSKVAVTVINRDKSIGVAEGGFGLSLRLNFVPRNEIIALGDQVVTSGLEPMVPRGLLVGTITAIENEAYRPFQQAVLTTMIPLSKLFIVGVISTGTTTATRVP